MQVYFWTPKQTQLFWRCEFLQAHLFGCAMAQSSSGVSDGESAEMNETSSLKSLEEVDENFGFGDDLELNQFDGLPYSSRYYKLLKERHQLPIWESRQKFMSALETNQLVIISGTTKTGKSTQVRWILYYTSGVTFKILTIVFKGSALI